MTVIRIQERDGGAEQANALLIFNHSVQYLIQVDDPFVSTPQQEENLEWYFEKYLTFPFTQDVRARRAAESIRHYGASLFKQIFADPRALMDYRQAIQKEGFHHLHIEIAGFSPSFHRLHWEALYDPDLQLHLALNAPMIRQNLEQQRFPATMRPAATIHVLVVVARPSGSRDVGYRTISRPLMDELEKISHPVEVTLLRPGTYQALEEHLENVTRTYGTSYYHVIHLDVHGGLLPYEAFQHGAQSNRYLYQGRFGRSDIDPYEGERAYLFLEGEGDEQADPVEASEMANLLLKHQIPMTSLLRSED